MTFRRMVAAARRTHEPNTIPFMYRTRLSTCAACIRDKDHLPKMISCMYKFRTWGTAQTEGCAFKTQESPKSFTQTLGFWTKYCCLHHLLDAQLVKATVSEVPSEHFTELDGCRIIGSLVHPTVPGVQDLVLDPWTGPSWA